MIKDGGMGFFNRIADSWKEINSLHYREKRRGNKSKKNMVVSPCVITVKLIKNKFHLILILDILRFRIVGIKMALNI